MYQKPLIIAEAGCNHMGSIETAHKMIETAAFYCKADAIKFQKRCSKELLTTEQYYAPHPNPNNAYGKTYGEHREFLEFTVDQHQQLQKWCQECGIEYASSVWDMTSAKEIASLNPKFIKIPSACNTNYEMLQWLCKNYHGEILLSFGMTTHIEEEQIVQIIEKNERAKDLVLFSCTSGYPVPFPDVCLLEITRMKQNYKNRVKSIAFSGHHLGIAVDVAAYTLGASMIERHYTLDRTWKGTDHAASLEPDGMRKLVRNLHAVYEALTQKREEILPIEQEQLRKLKYKT
ncbi:MAG: N-acetylneuraminate synthase family protein [Lachnospiraceae bacterium]|nr:N-acetylneuraminate synthase family protein [Lachnospiraceae bacterium]